VTAILTLLKAVFQTDFEGIYLSRRHIEYLGHGFQATQLWIAEASDAFGGEVANNQLIIVNTHSLVIEHIAHSFGYFHVGRLIAVGLVTMVFGPKHRTLNACTIGFGLHCFFQALNTVRYFHRSLDRHFSIS